MLKKSKGTPGRIFHSPKPKAKRKTNLTPASAAIIGLLIRLPNAQLVGNIKQTADRMVKLGWLCQRTGKNPQTAGLYEYEVDVPVYDPTEEGLALYNDHSVLKGVPPKQLRFAARLTEQEERLISEYTAREKRIKEFMRLYEQKKS